MTENTYVDLNAQLYQLTADGKINFEADKAASRAYFLEHVNNNTVFFHTLREKYDYLVTNGMWENLLDRYSFEEIKAIFQRAYGHKFRFETFVGALKFYIAYALKTTDGSRYLERYEDRVAMNALVLADGDPRVAGDLVDAIIEARYQPATPTFLNAGRAAAGDLTSCYLLRLEDDMESIGRGIVDSLQLSKRGGGVALLLSNIRESGAPIKKLENQSSGIIPIMKLLEDSFSYANQLGQRQGAGAVYLNVHHPDIMKFLDTKRENADEKIRIKTLSLGVVVPDITFELARNNEDMYLFSPYDVERVMGKPFADLSVTEHYREWADNPEIHKTKISPRALFRTLAEIQFESGYPYLMFEDTANRHNPAPNVGRIVQSNLCSEIMQPSTASTFHEDNEFGTVGKDISCNLGSMNVAKALEGGIERTVSSAYQALNHVAETSAFSSSPSVSNGNQSSYAIGLGQMNLHGALIERGIDYDSEEGQFFFHAYMDTVTYWLILASALKAADVGPYTDFHGSRWEDGSYIGDMIHHREGRGTDEERAAALGIDTPTLADWKELQEMVMETGIHNRHLQAIPPTGSISYINHATASIHPITAGIEVRKEGKLGRVYYPAYGLTNENAADVKDAFQIGPNPIIDMYAEAAPYVDQGMSLTLFFPDTATTRDINKAQIYAHKRGVKSIYYIRTRQAALSGTGVDGCLSCML